MHTMYVEYLIWVRQALDPRCLDKQITPLPLCIYNAQEGTGQQMGIKSTAAL